MICITPFWRHIGTVREGGGFLCRNGGSYLTIRRVGMRYAHSNRLAGAAPSSWRKRHQAPPEAEAQALLDTYFGSIDQDMPFARMLLIEVPGVSAHLNEVYRTAMQRFGSMP